MSDQNSHNDLFKDNFPDIPIPPSDEGWDKMKVKLDKTLPLNVSSNGMFNAVKRYVIISVGAVVIVSGAWLFYKSQNVKSRIASEKKQSIFENKKTIDSFEVAYSKAQLNEKKIDEKKSTSQLAAENRTALLSVSSQKQHRSEVYIPTVENDSLRIPFSHTTNNSEEADIVVKQLRENFNSNKVIRADSSSDKKTERFEFVLLPLTIKEKIKFPSGVNSSLIWNKKAVHQPYWSFQLQWLFQLPFNNYSAYFINPAGDSRAFRMLLPGFRVVNVRNLHSWSAEINPWGFQLYNSVPYYQKSGSLVSAIGDSTRLLKKTFGYNFAAQYHHVIVKNWWAAAGAEVYFARKANMELIQVKDTLGTKEYSAGEDKEEVWKHIGKLQGNVLAETYYNAPRWQSGIRVAVPAYMQAKDSVGEGMRSGLKIELIFRLKIDVKKKK